MVLERSVPMHRSCVWELQAAFYRTMRQEAWNREVVPSFLTTNAYIARSYANVILGVLQDSYAGDKSCSRTSPKYRLHAGLPRGHISRNGQPPSAANACLGLLGPSDRSRAADSQLRHNPMPSTAAAGRSSSSSAGTSGTPDQVPEYARPYKAMGGDPSRPWGTSGSEPVYILELGAGHGRLAFHILEFLRRARDSFPASSTATGVPFVYIVSDASEENVRELETNAQLQPFVNLGCLDFAVVDADAELNPGEGERAALDPRDPGSDRVHPYSSVSASYCSALPTQRLPPSIYLSISRASMMQGSHTQLATIPQIVLRSSGTVLHPGTLAHPLVVVANYVADSLRHSAFRIDRGEVRVCDVTMTATIPARESEGEDEDTQRHRGEAMRSTVMA